MFQAKAEKQKTSSGVGFASISLTKASYMCSPQARAGIDRLPHPEPLDLRMTNDSGFPEPDSGIRTFSVKIGTVLDEPGCIGGSVGMFIGQEHGW